MKWAPPSCHGSIPKRSATQMWLGLQHAMEQAAQEATGINGAVLDIVKCFNHLPRIPVFGVLKVLGGPSQVLRSWGKAITKMTRRFSIRGSTGPALQACTGFPEGCPLSVVSMLATNIVIDQWMRCRAPRVQTWTFVDNIEVLAASATDTIQGVEALRTILEVLDLPVDDDKTYYWANSTNARFQFRSLGAQVKASFRDLGGHIQYNQMTTNHVVTERIRTFKPRWKDLAISKAGYTQKLLAIKAVAWPGALHAIASVHVGSDWLDGVRTGALRALGEHKPGCSPLVHLSMGIMQFGQPSTT